LKARPSIEKRRKEQARQEAMQKKAAKREARKADRAASPGKSTDDEDPDLIGLVAGPQPPLED
jgi:hypothetical protein